MSASQEWGFNLSSKMTASSYSFKILKMDPITQFAARRHILQEGNSFHLDSFWVKLLEEKNSYKCESWMFPALPHFRHSCRKLCVVSLPWVTPDPAAALMSLALLAVGAPSEFSWPLTLQLVCLWIVPDSWIMFNFYSFFKLSPVCVFSRNSLCPGAHNHTTSNRFS